MEVCINIVLLTGFLQQGRSLLMITRPETHIRGVADTLTLPCEFHVFHFNLFDNPVLWLKEQKDEQTQINLQGNINSPFFDRDNRFSVNFTPLSPTYRFDLVIEKVRRADNGNYTCIIRAEDSSVQGSVTHVVRIQAPATTLRITNQHEEFGSTPRDVLTYEEDLPEPLRCSSRGAFPAPSVQLWIGSTEISKTMQPTFTLESHGVLGLRVLSYVAERFTYTFNALAEYDGQHLVCRVVVPGLEPNTTSVRLHVKYMPRIKCDRATAYANQLDVNVTCLIMARPRTSDIEWHLPDDRRHRLFDSDSFRSFTRPLNLTATLATLCISRVEVHHFRSYLVTAKNVKGRSEARVSLELVRRTTTPPVPTAVASTREDERYNSNGKYVYIVGTKNTAAEPPCDVLQRTTLLAVAVSLLLTFF